MPETTIIDPTVGRLLHYKRTESALPLVATITRVNEDGTINVGLFDEHGRPYSDGKQGVKLRQAGDPVPERGEWAEWMPCQVGQASGSGPAIANDLPLTVEGVEGLPEALKDLADHFEKAITNMKESLDVGSIEGLSGLHDGFTARIDASEKQIAALVTTAPSDAPAASNKKKGK